MLKLYHDIHIRIPKMSKLEGTVSTKPQSFPKYFKMYPWLFTNSLTYYSPLITCSTIRNRACPN